MHRRTRIKICGITRLEDAMHAVENGVDALGFVFVGASKRNIDVQRAAQISASLPAFVARVGLFLDAPADNVRAVLDQMPELVPQFHGVESTDYCESFGRPYIKAVGAIESVPDADGLDAYKSAIGLLYDSHEPGALGGTGKTFDWSRLTHGSHAPLILAGGLGVGNIGEAIAQVKPYAVDVSSGVEQDKGIKDANLINQFCAEVFRADQQLNH